MKKDESNCNPVKNALHAPAVLMIPGSSSFGKPKHGAGLFFQEILR
jgi:hypothetical protein